MNERGAAPVEFMARIDSEVHHLSAQFTDHLEADRRMEDRMRAMESVVVRIDERLHSLTKGLWWLIGILGTTMAGIIVTGIGIIWRTSK